MMQGVRNIRWKRDESEPEKKEKFSWIEQATLDTSIKQRWGNYLELIKVFAHQGSTVISAQFGARHRFLAHLNRNLLAASQFSLAPLNLKPSTVLLATMQTTRHASLVMAFLQHFLKASPDISLAPKQSSSP